MIDHVQYFSDALKPWIANRDRLGRFVIRRDPRDISRVWVLDPEGSEYIDVPYRRLSHPPVSVWEQRAAVATLRAEGRAEVDEEALFRRIDQMREIVDAASSSTKRARREVARRAVIPSSTSAASSAAPPESGDTEKDSEAAGRVVPFAEIEEW